MIRLSTLLLAPPVGERLSERSARRVVAGGRVGLLVGVIGVGVYAAGNAALAGDSRAP